MPDFGLAALHAASVSNFSAAIFPSLVPVLVPNIRGAFGEVQEPAVK
jgi:hypothetical protein